MRATKSKGSDRMKGIVIYDSVYGNTKKVAEAIADQIKKNGHEAQLISVKDGPKSLAADFLFLGSPTRMFKMTGDAKSFLRQMKALGWKDQPVIFFDTMMGVPEDMEERNKGKWAKSGAAPKLREEAKDLGMNAQEKVLHIGVTGLKGPLVATASEESAKFVDEVLKKIKP